MTDEVKIPLTEDQLNGIGAIYSRAHQIGYRQGFADGAAEKAWLQKHWPAIVAVVSCVMMAVGLVLGGETRP